MGATSGATNGISTAKTSQNLEIRKEAEFYLGRAVAEIYRSGRLYHEFERIIHLQPEPFKALCGESLALQNSCTPKERALLEALVEKIKTKINTFLDESFEERPQVTLKNFAKESAEKINLTIQNVLLQEIKSLTKEMQALVPGYFPGDPVLRDSVDKPVVPKVVPLDAMQITPAEPQVAPLHTPTTEEQAIFKFLNTIIHYEDKQFIDGWRTCLVSACQDPLLIATRASILDTEPQHDIFFRNLTLLVFIRHFVPIHEAMATLPQAPQVRDFEAFQLDSGAYLWYEIFQKTAPVKRKSPNEPVPPPQSKLSSIPAALKKHSVDYQVHLAQLTGKIQQQYQALIDVQSWEPALLRQLQHVLNSKDAQAYQNFMQIHAVQEPKVSRLMIQLEAPVPGFLESLQTVVNKMVMRHSVQSTPAKEAEGMDIMTQCVLQKYQQFLQPESPEYAEAKKQLEIFKQDGDHRLVALLEVLKRKIYNACTHACNLYFATSPFLSDDQRALLVERNGEIIDTAIESALLPTLPAYDNATRGNL